MKVLIVDDDVFNQEVLQLRLEEFNVETIVLENGQEAVDFIVSGKTVDLIFMDINMPILDGDKATKLIREYEVGSSTRVPIIAVGASIENQDRERFISCGMDDCIEKPIIQEKLEEVLNKILFRTTTFLYDIRTVSQSLKIPEKTIKALINKLTKALERELPIMKMMAQKEDYKSLEALAHKLKGRFATLQIEPLYALCITIEQNAKKEVKYDYDTFIDKMSEHNNVLKEL